MRKAQTKDRLRFVRWRQTKSGRMVAKCMGMRRVQLEEGYRFRCMRCNRDGGRVWVWPPDGASTTTQKAPLEVRLHVMAHHPDRRWATVWRTPKPNNKECPSCGFDLNSWRIPPKPETQEDDD
jgi:hypothetical protein